MDYPELRRLAADAPNNPDLLFGLMDRNGDLPGTISFLNDNGYNVTENDINDIIASTPNIIEVTRQQISDGARADSLIAIVIVIVAVFVWVIMN